MWKCWSARNSLGATNISIQNIDLEHEFDELNLADFCFAGNNQRGNNQDSRGNYHDCNAIADHYFT